MSSVFLDADRERMKLYGYGPVGLHKDPARGLEKLLRPFDFRLWRLKHAPI